MIFFHYSQKLNLSTRPTPPSDVLQVRHRPYMSTVERESVKESHRLKAHEAELAILELGSHKVESDLLMHHEMQKGILQLIEKNPLMTFRSFVQMLDHELAC